MLEKALAIAIILLLAYSLFVCVWLAFTLRHLQIRLEDILDQLKNMGIK